MPRQALRDYVFAVIPLFMLMGDFLAKCGAARDLYALAHRFSRWLPAQLAVATIISNALFAFVTGVSIAAAAAFSRIAYPEMQRFGYRRDFALGCVAGSACLGMLIPPSVLMIVWAVLTEISIGKLFLAGVIPGIITAAPSGAARLTGKRRAAFREEVPHQHEQRDDREHIVAQRLIGGVGDEGADDLDVAQHQVHAQHRGDAERDGDVHAREHQAQHHHHDGDHVEGLHQSGPGASGDRGGSGTVPRARPIAAVAACPK